MAEMPGAQELSPKDYREGGGVEENARVYVCSVRVYVYVYVHRTP